MCPVFLGQRRRSLSPAVELLWRHHHLSPGRFAAGRATPPSGEAASRTVWATLTLNQAVEKMRGPVNTKIKLTIMRKGQDKPIEVTIVRDVIRVKSVRSHAEGDDVGYIRITQFSEQTTEGLKKAISDLTSQLGSDKIKGFVVDLRNNPGGLLDQAISVSDAFLDKGEIVSTRGRNAEETQRFNAHAGDLTKGKPVIVLINGGSASASEIVAGALQDQKRATLVGTRSFGKGSVQTIMPLGAGNGALRLTTARYFTPSGRSIQAKGIEPDIKVLQEVPSDLKARTDAEGEASLRGHLKAEGSEESGSQSYVPTDEKDDRALKEAFDLLRGTITDAAFPPDRLVLPLAHDGELDLGIHRPAHLLDRLIERQAVHLLIVDLGNDVIGHHAGFSGGRIVNRRHHLHQTVFHCDLDTNSAKLAPGLHLNVAQATWIHVARMWIQTSEHAIDRKFDEL